MKKKILSLFLAASMALSLAACGSPADSAEADAAVEALMAGSLSYNPDTTCHHHDHEGGSCGHHGHGHGDGESCGHHGHGHGCRG